MDIASMTDQVMGGMDPPSGQLLETNAVKQESDGAHIEAIGAPTRQWLNQNVTPALLQAMRRLVQEKYVFQWRYPKR